MPTDLEIHPKHEPFYYSIKCSVCSYWLFRALGFSIEYSEQISGLLKIQ